MRKDEPRSRYLGLPLPRPNLKADYAEQAKRFAHDLVDVPRRPVAAIR